MLKIPKRKDLFFALINARFYGFMLVILINHYWTLFSNVAFS
jgi:hypothetical protein